MGDLPVMNMNDADGRQAQGMTYVDSLAQNNAKFSYRIRKNHFWRLLLLFRCCFWRRKEKSLEASPRISNFEISDDENITINWEFPQEAEKDIASFELLHSGN